MFSLLAKRQPSSLIHRLPLFVAKLFASKSKSKSQIPEPKTSSDFIVDYLISSFGFSPDKAATVSKRIAHLNSPQKPDSVRHFLKHHGFNDFQIKTIITWRPEILCSSIQNTLDPNLCALREMGLSSPAVAQIVLSDPRALLSRNSATRIKFCRDFLGGSEAALVRACKASRIAGQDTVSKISLLYSLGLSTHEIQRIVLTIPRIMNCSPTLIKDLLNRAKELGFQPGSAMFVSGLHAISGNSRETLQKKMELLKSYGWSEDNFFAALWKSPNIVYLGEKNLQAKMDFLMAEVGCAASYTAANPMILSYSLEKRLRPRHHVLQLLESKSLSSTKYNFTRSIQMSDEKFVDTYIQPHKEELPGVHENFLATLRPDSAGLDS